MAAIRERRLELAGFRTRALEVDGPGGAGESLLLLHGWSDSADCWRPLMSRLARRGRRALAVDLPGFGQASRLAREQPILPQLDRFVAAAVAHQSAGGDRVVAVGNSLGGCAALRAGERPELPLAGIVPIAPAGLDMARWITLIEGERLLRLLMRAPLPVPEVVVRDVVGRLYRALAFARQADVDPAVVAAYTRHLRSRRDVARVLAIGRRLRSELDDPFRLWLVRRPVLLVWGDRDLLVFPTGAERVLREIPGSRIEVIERCGHCPQIEVPDRLVALLDAFPAELARAA